MNRFPAMKIPPMSAAEKERILLVEDDQELAALIGEYLTQQQFDVGIEHDGAAAVQRILDEQPRLVVLDLMLPGKDGISICREVRAGYRGSILMLTASNDSVDQILGLEIGADDFVHKPVEPRVLLARIRALLRRVESAPVAAESSNAEMIRFEDLRINKSARSVVLAGEELDLTNPEYEVLQYMAEHAGVVVSRDDLFGALRNLEYDGQNRLIDITISRLRKKLGDSADRYLKTVRGKGYLFVLNG